MRLRWCDRGRPPGTRNAAVARRRGRLSAAATLALCERYGSEESAVAAVVRGRHAGVPGLPYRDDWPAWNAAEMGGAVDYLEQAGVAATESGALGR